MAERSLAELIRSAGEADGPSFVPASELRPGGVDPLGLRQINFDLMDQVFPGLNNVARHIRPFVVVTWAWRRAQQIAEAESLAIVRVDQLRDFVDRIEVIYAWSQFLRDPEADLPGQQVLAILIRSDKWTFGGKEWDKRREERRYSTGLMAPINYGPGLKSLRWIGAHQARSDVFIPFEGTAEALNAFEGKVAGFLSHPAFSKFGSVEVTRDEVRSWGDAWALDKVTAAERHTMAEMLFGLRAPAVRQRAGRLTIAAATHIATADVARVRRAMAGAPSDLEPTPDLLDTIGAWRRVQVRQLFRYSLEALFYWIVWQVDEGGPMPTTELVDRFLVGIPDRSAETTAGSWLGSPSVHEMGPVHLIEQITEALGELTDGGLPSCIANGIAFSVAQESGAEEAIEQIDRLPLFRARREAGAWSRAPAREFLRHIFESWVFAQHAYWSVGRGLADARAGGKTILRLKLVLEDQGWSLVPGAVLGAPPVPTADRLETALSLAGECDLLAIS